MITKPSYVADFETITRNNKECVWLWDVCNIATKKHTTDTTIESFIKWLNDITVATNVYFHNLKFDGSFIIDFMLKAGFTMQNVDTRRLKKFQFNTLVTEFGQFFQIVYKNRHNKIITFIDSLKLFPFSVDKLAKDFNLPISKGSIDYNMERPEGYIPTDKEIEYCQTDTQIVADCLYTFLSEGHKKITLSSCAFSEYKQIIGTSRYNNWFGWWRGKAPLELDREIRRSYRGGFCQCNEKFINTTIKQPVWYNDVNSLYPYVMRTAYLPYGQPVEFEGEYKQSVEYPYYIQKIKIDMQLKKDGIPCILNKSNGVNCNYVVDTQIQSTAGACMELTLTCFDLELIYRNYEIYHLEFIGGYMFKIRNDMFTDYVDKYYQMKELATVDGNGAKRTIAKLFLNSLYGKFGQNPVRRKKLPFVDYDNKIHFYKSNKEVANKFNYLPVATFITSIARYKVITDIEKVGKQNWVYTDTDSILTTCPLPVEIVDNKELGKYKVEQIFKKCRVLGPKTYWGVNTKNEITAKACGCTKKALKNIPLGKFNYGSKITGGRTTLQTVDGGKKIDFNDFTIKDKRNPIPHTEYTDKQASEILKDFFKNNKLKNYKGEN